MLIPVFYVPSLHPDSVPAQLPRHVAFFPSGLPEPLRDDRESEAGGIEEKVRNALPLNPGQAEAALAEMLLMGEEYAGRGLLKELAAHRMLASREDGRKGKPGEFAELSRFSETGELAERDAPLRMPDWGGFAAEARAASAEAIRQATLACQKTLLLAYSLEKRGRELARLEERCSEMERALRSSLGEEEAACDKAVVAAEGKSAQPGSPVQSGSLSWRVLVDAALPFLPERGVLFTADAAMTDDLREAGMLQAFPEDKAAACARWPRELVEGLLFVSLPAWRLVGRKGPLPERPWLARDVEVFVARPRGGWVSPAVKNADGEKGGPAGNERSA